LELALQKLEVETQKTIDEMVQNLADKSHHLASTKQLSKEKSILIEELKGQIKFIENDFTEQISSMGNDLLIKDREITMAQNSNDTHITKINFLTEKLTALQISQTETEGQLKMCYVENVSNYFCKLNLTMHARAFHTHANY